MCLTRLRWKQGPGDPTGLPGNHTESALEKSPLYCGPRGLNLTLLGGSSGLSEGAGSKDQSQGRRDMGTETECLNLEETSLGQLWEEVAANSWQSWDLELRKKVTGQSDRHISLIGQNSPPLFLQGPFGGEHLPETALPLSSYSTPSHFYGYFLRVIVLENNWCLNLIVIMGRRYVCGLYSCISLPGLRLSQGRTPTVDIFTWKVHSSVEGSQWASAIEIPATIPK